MLNFAFEPSPAAPVTIDIARGYLLGPNELSIPGEIQLRGGRLECAAKSKAALALHLECELKELGRLSLSTCLLQQRREPYPLLLELARHCIKQFIAKCEDWQIWAHPGAADALAQWNEARMHFTKALTTQDRSVADELSLRALINGVQASERLALAQSSISTHRRFGAKAASRMVLGVRIDPLALPATAGVPAKSFDMIALPISWARIERAPGKYDFSSVAQWIDWSTKTGRTILTGPVIDLRPESVPPWIAQKRGDFAALRDGVWKFSDAVGRELAGRTGMWNISCAMNDNDWWQLTLEQMVELSRRIVIGVRQTRKGVPTLLEIRRPFAHDTSARAGAVTPRALVEAIGEEGIHLDCLMLQFVMGENGFGRLTRDLLAVSSMLDSYASLRKSLFVAIGAPSDSRKETAGYWRSPWSAKTQAEWASRMFSIAMSKSHVGMVIWESLMDCDPSRPTLGALNAQGQSKPVLDALVSLRRSLIAPVGEWRSPDRTVSDSSTAIDAVDSE